MIDRLPIQLTTDWSGNDLHTD